MTASPTLIGLSGKQYAGKDQVAALLLEALPGYEKIPLALAIKKAYAAQHNLTLAQIEADKAVHRPGLIALGDWGRAQDPDYWLKQVLTLPGNKIISDVRLMREHDLLRQMGATLIRVEADRDIRAHRGTLVKEDDPTECALDEIRDWDKVILNNGTMGDLRQAVAEVCRSLKPQ